MKEKVDVSVVIPVYNAKDFLTECVESVVNQKGEDLNIEIILVNDGSTDGSGDICEKLEKQYTNVIFIDKKNSGVSDTRNTGIKRAQGKYILMLDSDDYLGDTTVSKLFEFFEEHYDEVDLVTYPIYWDKEGKKSAHPRYKANNYNKGTGVYDLYEYPGLNQSTVNIIFKNKFEENILYDINMKLSEDQNFDTCILMQKKKIGFVKEARYYYRRYGGGVSQTRNNPYYCFDDIISYNEGLLERFVVDGEVPKYVQTLIVNTFDWRIKGDLLLPYHYDEKKYQEAINRIKNILKKIDNDVIIKHSTCSVYVKIFLLKWKGEAIKYYFDQNGITLLDQTGELICERTPIYCRIYRVKEEDGKVSIFAAFESPVLQVISSPRYIIEGKMRNGKRFRNEYDIQASRVPFNNTKMQTAQLYSFEYSYNPREIRKFSFKMIIDGVELNTQAVYLRFCGFVKKYHRDTIGVGQWRLSYHRDKQNFIVTKQNTVKKAFDIVKTWKHYPKKHVMGIFYYRFVTKTHRNIWLYYDSANVLDNGYYQFIHDFNKKDGVERYYIVDGELENIENKFTAEQKKYLVKHKSKLHKHLFLKSSKIFVSYSSLSIYNPFKNVNWYSDVTHYELIYLQHGVLHASLQRLYAKEYTEIDKFVISSDFEKQNLMDNYDYSEKDLIVSGMPRMGIEEKTSEAKNKILFAPSWRQYLIGQLIDNRRQLKEKEFLASDYYKEICAFIQSNTLKRVLQENDMKLEIKMHPIFRDYAQLLPVEGNNIKLKYDDIHLSEYKMFITDFSSYQFDYIKLVRPVIYFLPDEAEFKAGLHSYQKLDLSYENAFGPLCRNGADLVQEIESILRDDCQVKLPYKDRMQSFYTISGNPSDTIYNILMDKGESK